jgi:hypothetical protein
MKKFSIVILLFLCVQTISFAQQKLRQDGVSVRITSGGSDTENAAIFENHNSYRVEVYYEITFVKRRGSLEEEVTRTGTLPLMPAGTPRGTGRPSDAYRVSAGGGLPVNFDATTVSIRVTGGSTLQKTDFPDPCRTCEGRKGYSLLGVWNACGRCGGTGTEPQR